MAILAGKSGSTPEAMVEKEQANSKSESGAKPSPSPVQANSKAKSGASGLKSGAKPTIVPVENMDEKEKTRAWGRLATALDKKDVPEKIKAWHKQIKGIQDYNERTELLNKFLACWSNGKIKEEPLFFQTPLNLIPFDLNYKLWYIFPTTPVFRVSLTPSLNDKACKVGNTLFHTPLSNSSRG